MLCRVCRYTLENLWRPENRINHVRLEAESTLDICKYWCVHHQDRSSWERSDNEGCALCMNLGCTCSKSASGRPCASLGCRRRDDSKHLTLRLEGPEHAQVYSAARIFVKEGRMKLQLRWPEDNRLSVSLVPLEGTFSSYSQKGAPGSVILVEG